MTWTFAFQTFGPAAFGMMFLASGVLDAKPKWIGRLAFLYAQLLQIYTGLIYRGPALLREISETLK